MKPSAHPEREPVDASIIELERQLDPMLRNRGPDKPFNPRLQVTVREWSARVWGAAALLGPSAPAAHELDRGLRLAHCPVFICGAARSGTTLLRDLLDGHPQLVVVPTESLFYTYLERALFDLRPERHCVYLGCRWLERLVAPPPYWLLGRSQPDGSPYVTFARDFAGWWQVPDQHREARNSSWPIAALAFAFSRRLGGGGLPRDAQMWVEKSPGSEAFLDRIWHDFPAAKVIQIVREPQAVLASMKGLRSHSGRHAHGLMHIVRHMVSSYRIAAASQRRRPKERYLLVRYEDLTADPDAVMTRVAEFLGIQPGPSLVQPTVTGRPATNNTSFGTSRPDLPCALNPSERALLALAVARPAAKLGYAPLKASSHGRHQVVGGLAQGQGADAFATDGVPPNV